MRKIAHAGFTVLICFALIVVAMIPVAMIPEAALAAEKSEEISSGQVAQVAQERVMPSAAEQKAPSAKYTGIHQDSDGVYRLYINGKFQKNATYIYKKTQYIKNGIWQKDFTGFYKSAKDGKYYLIINGIFQKGATYLHIQDGKYYYVKDGTWRYKFNGLYTSQYDGNSYLIVNGILDTSATYLYIKDGKYYYLIGGMWQKNYNGLYTSKYDGNSYLIKNGILDTSYTGMYIGADSQSHYIRGGMKTTPDKVIYLTFDDGPGPYTDRLINILNKYNAKATFFVTGNNSYYLDSRIEFVDP